MEQITRAQYRAAIREEINERQFDILAERCRVRLEALRQQGRLLTAGLFRYQQHLFFYLEPVIQAGQAAGELAEQWLAELAPMLEMWPEFAGKRHWAEMYPVFWFDTPQSRQQWSRRQPPDARCGRIALLYPERLFSYVYHHQDIMREGLLVGDRYQFISLHENILFSYFETPRDRERVNLRRTDGESQAIKEWLAVDPPQHFQHFVPGQQEDFVVIPTVFSVG